MDKQELYKETYEAMGAIYKQWGNVRTPFGCIWRVKQSYGWSSHIPFGHKGISIRVYEWSESYSSKASMDAILRLASETLPAMANYLASEDFTNKVKGCMRRLKAVTKALQA